MKYTEYECHSIEDCMEQQKAFREQGMVCTNTGGPPYRPRAKVFPVYLYVQQDNKGYFMPPIAIV